MTPSGVLRRVAAGARRRRVRVVAAVTAGLLVVLAGPAYAYWTATGTAQAQAATLVGPQLTVGSVTPTTADLTWTKPFVPTGYTLTQSPGTLTDCPPAPAVTSTTCQATSLTPGTTYTWNLSAYLGNWVSPATVSATTPRQPTTTALSDVTPTAGFAGTAFSATATVSGGWGTPAGTVTFSLYPNSTCTGPPSDTASQPLSSQTVSATLYPAAGTYSWQASFVPSDTFNAGSTSACGPSVIVTALTYAGATSPVTGQNNGKADVSIPYLTSTKTGDLILLVLANRGSKKDSPPSNGWTEISSGADGSLAVWWHVAASGEKSVTLTSLGGSNAAWIVDYTTSQSVSKWNVAKVSGTLSSASSTFTPPTALSAAGPSTVVSLAAVDTSGPLSLLPDASQGFAWHSAPLSTSGPALGVADRLVTTAGSVTVAEPTWTAAAPPHNWAYVTMGFTPVP